MLDLTKIHMCSVNIARVDKPNNKLGYHILIQLHDSNILLGLSSKYGRRSYKFTKLDIECMLNSDYNSLSNLLAEYMSRNDNDSYLRIADNVTFTNNDVQSFRRNDGCIVNRVYFQDEFLINIINNFIF